MKGDPMDLRLDIERRKKYPIQDRDCNQERGREMRDSPDSSRERPVEKVSRCHKKSKYVQPYFVLLNVVIIALGPITLHVPFPF